MAVAGPGHKVVHQVIRALDQRLGEPLQIPPRESVGTSRFLGIHAQVVGVYLDLFLHRCELLQVHVERKHLARPQHEIIGGHIVAGRLYLQCVSSRSNRGKTKLTIAIGQGGGNRPAVLML